MLNTFLFIWILWDNINQYSYCYPSDWL